MYYEGPPDGGGVPSCRFPALYGAREINLSPELQMLMAVAVGAGPDPDKVVDAKGVENIVDGLTYVMRASPLEVRHGLRVWEVHEVEADLAGIVAKAAPDLDEAVMLADGSNICRVVGQRRDTGRVREGLAPRAFGHGCRLVELEGGMRHEELFICAP